MSGKWFVDGMEVTTKLEEALVTGFIDLKKRIGELEETTALCGPGWATEIKGRVAALETQLSRLDVSTITAAVKMLETERERRQDWKDMYRHVFGGLCVGDNTPTYAGSVVQREQRAKFIEDCHAFATLAADRAHGPFEVIPAEKAGEQPIDRYFANVNALVKAAQALSGGVYVANVIPSLDVRAVSSALVDNLRAALKPFEQEAGRG
jgi:hypothetical protein